MNKLKRRDFMKILGIAVACPIQLLNAKSKMIQAHGVTLEGSTIGLITVFGKESMYLTGEANLRIDTKGYNYLKINFGNRKMMN